MKKLNAKKIKVAGQRKHNPVPILRFSPTAWAKLLFLRDCGETEVGGFGISACDDLLLVEDVRLVKQVCSWAHVAFDDTSVADFFDEQVDAGRRPKEFARCWIHTHPLDSPQPSTTDEKTFECVFGRADWAIMFILAQGGAHYARLQFNVGPGGCCEMPVEIDYRHEFSSTDILSWKREYQQFVRQDQTALAETNLFDSSWITEWQSEDPKWEEVTDDWWDEDNSQCDRWTLTPLGEEVNGDIQL